VLQFSNNPILNPSAAPSVANIESDLRRLPHLASDLRVSVKHLRRSWRDARKVLTAAEAIGTIPAADESLHLAISGRFALWNVVPAVLKLASTPISELRIATLGFSKKNIGELCSLLDEGQIGHAKLLASHYFKSTSGDIYEHARTELEKRPDRATFLSLRNHAKLLLMKLADGRTVSVESSANLRSCKNIEQMTLIGDPGVHDFHAGWIDGLFEVGVNA